MKKLVLLTRHLRHVPSDGDLRLAAKNNTRFPSDDTTFPAHSVFRRLGSKSKRISRVTAFCEAHTEYEDVGALWKQVRTGEQQNTEGTGLIPQASGYVYLLKHGTRREYKIGRTHNPLRREGEVGIELPEKLQPIHYIETDDPAGIEKYWHTRFASKRKEGEWFALTSDDVRAFKRWKRIY